MGVKKEARISSSTEDSAAIRLLSQTDLPNKFEVRKVLTRKLNEVDILARGLIGKATRRFSRGFMAETLKSPSKTD